MLYYGLFYRLFENIDRQLQNRCLHYINIFCRTILLKGKKKLRFPYVKKYHYHMLQYIKHDSLKVI